MTEVDVDAQIKSYWARKENEIPEEFLHWIEEQYKGFQDATEDNPVDTAEFLSHLDLSCAKKFFKSLYKRKPTFPAEATVKSFFLFDIRRKRFYTELWKYLISHPDDAQKLGFPKKDGRVLIPGVKNLWHFYNIRMDWDEFFKILRNETVKEGKDMGLKIGRRTMEDSMPVEAFHTDKEAEYNDYYKINGYKLDTVDDLETNVPLSKETIGINEDEAKQLIPHMEDMSKDNIKVKEHWIDGGYDDYPNLAWMGVHGIEAHHRIHKNWVKNEKGNVDHLQELYQKNWKDSRFKPNADMHYILSFLLKKGYEEEVGAYFRNLAMKRYDEDSQSYLKVYHKRSRKEGNHGYWKEQLQLKERMRVKGIANVDRFLTRNLCALLSVALNRLQHGIKRNLTSIASLT